MERRRRSPCAFRQGDVTRAIRGAFAAGAVRAEFRVGEIVITAEKTASEEITVASGNEWDALPAGDGRPQ